MSGETEQYVSGWTVDTLHSHFISLLNNQKEYFEQINRDWESRWTRVHAEEIRAAEARMENYRIQREDDRRLSNENHKLTDAATQFHLDSRKQWQDGHLEVHKTERETRDAASNQMDRRLDGMNEFRDQLRDQALQFLPRAEAQAQAVSVERAAQVDHDRLADMVTRQEMNLQFDSLKGQLSALQKGLQDTTQLLATVRSRDAGKSSGTNEAIEAANRAEDAAARNKNILYGGIAVFLAALAIAATLFIGLRNHSSASTPTTPTTIRAPYAPPSSTSLT